MAPDFDGHKSGAGAWQAAALFADTGMPPTILSSKHTGRAGLDRNLVAAGNHRCEELQSPKPRQGK
jgi:hypothetical protein